MILFEKIHVISILSLTEILVCYHHVSLETLKFLFQTLFDVINSFDNIVF